MILSFSLCAMISPSGLREFRDFFFQEYGIELSDDSVNVYAQRVLMVFRVMYAVLRRGNVS